MNRLAAEKDAELTEKLAMRGVAGLAHDYQIENNLLNQFTGAPPYQGKIYNVTATNNIPSVYYAANTLLNK